jgi:sulfite exporter TauE/SafE
MPEEPHDSRGPRGTRAAGWEQARRRNFSSLLILANLFRGVSYVIVGLAIVATVATGIGALLSSSPDPLLQLAFRFAGVAVLGLLMFLVSELIRLFVGMGRDIARMAGRDAPAAGPTPEEKPPV